MHFGKTKGTYITLEVPKLKDGYKDLNEKVSKRVAEELRKISNLKENDTVLVVGLGNWDITADALGPKVVSNIEVTRHLIEYVPQYVKPGTRPVCAVAPGVLGTTGIESEEIIKGIVEKIKPNLIMVIDALASRKMERVSTTIQIANTGIVPGSGVGNKRNAITEETMGIPVIAIGVPTVVDAATIANDCIDLYVEKMQQEAKSTECLNRLKEEDKYQIIKEALTTTNDYNFIVTPKEVDEIITNVSDLVAESINEALYNG